MSLLTCQNDAYIRQCTTQVLACNSLSEGVEVRLGHTLLYPEGGGQPDDYGTIDGMPVQGLRKDPDGAVWHRLAQRPAQDEVHVVLDWARRLDHMQQHTAQHLISALAEDRLGAPTTAFHLRPDVSDIDVGTALSARAVRELEEWVNAAIREDRPVRSQLVQPADLQGVRSRSLPEGLTGAVRLIEIAGIDRNTCGGTHVARLGELQAVSLLPPLKNKGGSKLRYRAGGRVLVAAQHSYNRAHALSKLLSSGPDEHVAAVQRLQRGAKDQARIHKALLSELAGLIGGALAHGPDVHLHREEADMAFLRAAATAATEAAPERVFLLTGGGMFMLAGPAGPVSALGPQVASMLGGRGGGARGRYQGRMERLDRLPEVSQLLRAAIAGTE